MFGCRGEYLVINQQDVFCILSFISGYVVPPTHPPTFFLLIAMILIPLFLEIQFSQQKSFHEEYFLRERGGMIFSCVEFEQCPAWKSKILSITTTPTPIA